MYGDQKEYASVNAASLASTGVKLTLSPGLVPIKVRAVAVIVTTQATVTPPVITLKRRPTAGSASGEVSGGTVTLPTARVAGDVVYKKGFDITVSPGENFVLDCTTAGTAGAADLVVEYERSWEVAGNNAKMFASA